MFYYIAPLDAGTASKTPAPTTDRTYHSEAEARRTIEGLCLRADVTPADFIIYKLTERRKGSRFAY
jgi:hypothetical protein